MIKLLATDLDGTIFTRSHEFLPEDVEVLEQLGEEGRVRVIATGRTLNSAMRVIPYDFPIDYLVFSSGAGVYNWPLKKLLYTRHLGNAQTKEVCAVLNQHSVCYTIHHAIPENHLFFYQSAASLHADFERYVSFNEQFATALNGQAITGDCSQVLAFVPNLDVFHGINDQLSNIKVVRATSPIDDKSIWMEFFNASVSKAEGIRYVCQLEGVKVDEVVVLGNDYNDLDMLNAFRRAFVVDNAPEELKQQFNTVCAATEGALKDVLKNIVTQR